MMRIAVLLVFLTFFCTASDFDDILIDEATNESYDFFDDVESGQQKTIEERKRQALLEELAREEARIQREMEEAEEEARLEQEEREEEERQRRMEDDGPSAGEMMMAWQRDFQQQLNKDMAVINRNSNQFIKQYNNAQKNSNADYASSSPSYNRPSSDSNYRSSNYNTAYSEPSSDYTRRLEEIRKKKEEATQRHINTCYGLSGNGDYPGHVAQVEFDSCSRAFILETNRKEERCHTRTYAITEYKTELECHCSGSGSTCPSISSAYQMLIKIKEESNSEDQYSKNFRLIK